MISITILTFTSMAINFIFLLVYRKAVKVIEEKDKAISHLQRQIDNYQWREQ